VGAGLNGPGRERVDMTFSEAQQAYVEKARVGRLATADAQGRPNVVPFCFALAENALVSALNEKPKGREVRDLRRVRDIEENPYVAAVVDEYSPDWSELAWVQVRGRAELVEPGGDRHAAGVAALWAKYDQYADHAIGERPLVRILPDHVRSWGLE